MSANYDIPFIPNAIEDKLKETIIVAGREAYLDLLAEQPWWKRISNTVTVALTSLFTMLGVFITFGVIKPTLWVGLLIVALFIIIQIITTKATRNGVTESVATKVNDNQVEAIARRAQEAIQPTLDAAYEAIPPKVQEKLDYADKRMKDLRAQLEATVSGGVTNITNEVNRHLDPSRYAVQDESTFTSEGEAPQSYRE